MSKILSDWSTSHNGLLGHKTDSVTNYQTSMMVEWLTNWPPIVSSQFKLHDKSCFLSTIWLIDNIYGCGKSGFERRRPEQGDLPKGHLEIQLWKLWKQATAGSPAQKRNWAGWVGCLRFLVSDGWSGRLIDAPTIQVPDSVPREAKAGSKCDALHSWRRPR